jgi:hypothetical protein
MASMHEANGCATCCCKGEGGKESGCVEMRLVVSSLRARHAARLVRRAAVFGSERIHNDSAQTASESKRLARPRPPLLGRAHPPTPTRVWGERERGRMRVWWW